MKLGAHVSIAGYISFSMQRAHDMGANTAQIFLSPPQNWNPPKFSEDDIRQFIKIKNDYGIGPVFAHAIYLINLASDNDQLVEKSKNSLVNYLNYADKLGLEGVIFHVGSTKRSPTREINSQIINQINDILKKTPHSKLIIETNAGQGYCMCSTFEEISQLISQSIQPERLAVCLDTAHIWASGYDLVNNTLGVVYNFDKTIGLEKLTAIHCNDSKSDLNSRVDRHANIGEGKLGLETFNRLLNIEQLKSIPFILEVPGIDNKGPDRANLEILKKLVKSSQ